jgi:hypothetical protein
MTTGSIPRRRPSVTTPIDPAGAIPTAATAGTTGTTRAVISTARPGMPGRVIPVGFIFALETSASLVPHQSGVFMSAEVLVPPPPGWPELVVATKSRWPELVVATKFGQLHGVRANAVRHTVGDSLRRLETDGTEHAALRRCTAVQPLYNCSARRTRPRCD